MNVRLGVTDGKREVIEGSMYKGIEGLGLSGYETVDYEYESK